MLADTVATDLLSSAIFEIGLMPLYRGLVSYVPRSSSRTKRAIARAAKALTEIPVQAGEPSEAWEAFLTSSDARTLMQDLFMFRLDPRDPSVSEIEMAFSTTWQTFAEARGISATAVDARAAFDGLANAAADMVQAATQDGVLAAHEARSVARHQIVEARLDVIERLARGAPKGVDPGAYVSFEAQVRREVSARASKIEPPNLLGRERVPIDRLFVVPRLSVADDRGEFEEMPFSAFSETVSRRVVLGHPGAGKSTLATRLCFELGGDRHGRRRRTRRPAPWFVELRRFSAADSLGATSLAEHFTVWARSSFQLEVPEGAFDWLLSRGRLLVVFDGLDELLDSSRRQDIRNAIESFCRRYATAPVLVTSRVVGYREAPLDESVFDVVHLNDFDESRISVYAKNWFGIRLADESPDDRQRHVDQFLLDSEVAGELRNSPLLLSLLATLHRGPGSIPNNLPDVYDRCASLLFSTWDKERGIDVVLPFAEHIRPALRELAWWLFTTPKLANGATQRQAVARTAAYLAQRRFGNADQARAAAEDFVRFCRGRAWVFTDRGTTTAGEDRFGFTHRTFLEFFTGEYLAYRKQTAEELVEELLPRIVDEEWDVVCLIALQIKARSYPEGADDVINALLEGLKAHRGRQLRSGAAFVLRLLRGVIPGPATTRRLGFLLTMFAARGRYVEDGQELMRGLAFVGAEVREEVQLGAVAGVARLMRAPNKARRRAGAEVVFHIDELGASVGSGSAMPFWRRVAKDMIEKHAELIEIAAKDDPAIARDAWPKLISTAGILEAHGISGLYFQRQTSGTTLRPDPIPIAVLLRDLANGRGRSDDFESIATYTEGRRGVYLNTGGSGHASSQTDNVLALASRALADLTFENQAARVSIWLVSALAVEELTWMAQGGSAGVDRRLAGFMSDLGSSRDSFFVRLASTIARRLRVTKVSSAVLQLAIDDAMKMATIGLGAADLGKDQAALARQWEAGRQLLSFGPAETPGHPA